ncbi:STAS domain-containing protein [Alienimonas sp. DA493]|uniref:STAS domain-containing protein n=1 Tax=Alienimonas sp. DA493 TaxID=3373605 RepID=UPI003754437A
MATERACRFEQDGNLLIITLLPELAEVPWADVEEIGSSLENRVLDRDKPQVIVDLTPLAHMGSGMVALVVRIWKAAQQQGGKFAVVNDHELVGEVLQLAGLADRWTIVTSREQARKHLDVRAQARPARSATVGGNAASDSAGGGGLLAACGVAAVLLSAAALILMFLAPELLPAVALKAALFAGAVLGIVLGTLALAWYLGVPRFTGVGVLLCSVALLVAGLVLEPNRGLDLNADADGSADLVVPDAAPPGEPDPADPAATPDPAPADPAAESVEPEEEEIDDAALIGSGAPESQRPTEVLSADSVRD